MLTEHTVALERGLKGWSVDCQHCFSVYLIVLREDMHKPTFCARCGQRTIVYNAEAK